MARGGIDGESPTLQGSFQQLQQMNEHNPAMIFDEEGRLHRWVKSPARRYKPFNETTSCCNCTKLTPKARQEDDLHFIAQMDRFQGQLYEELEVRQRAI